MELKGKLIRIKDVQKIETVSNGVMEKREFWLDASYAPPGEDERTIHVAFELMGDKVSIIDGFNLHDIIKVDFNIVGKIYEKDGKENLINNNRAWKVGLIKAAQQ